MFCKTFNFFCNESEYKLSKYDAIPKQSTCFLYSGERLSLLVLRTAPGLGNVTVDWTVRGPSVYRTFDQTLGKLFFAEVKENNNLCC